MALFDILVTFVILLLSGQGPANRPSGEKTNAGPVQARRADNSQVTMPHVLGIPRFQAPADVSLPAWVKLELELDARGRVVAAKAVGLQGRPAAVMEQAAKSLVFTPARKNGKPLACRIHYWFQVRPGRDEPGQKSPSRHTEESMNRTQSPRVSKRQGSPRQTSRRPEDPAEGDTKEPAMGDVEGQRQGPRPGAHPSKDGTAHSPRRPSAPVKDSKQVPVRQRHVVRVPEYHTEVRAERPLTASSDRKVRAKDFMLLPRRTPADMLLMVPALHISQHSGSGKGHQIFLRGFDAEHGQDVALYLEGVPLNQSSHVHGIGYTDLHFLIPEAVQRMDVLKGPYDPRYGDYAVAGAINFILKDRVEKSYVAADGGSFRTLGATLVYSPRVTWMNALVALQTFRTDGFSLNGKWSGFRTLAKLSRPFAAGKLSVVAAGYASDWKAPDAVPQRLVESGQVDFYGGLDDSDGGGAHLGHLSVHYDQVGAKDRFEALAYLSHIRTDIFTNYTYFLQFPDHGDQTEQSDSRWVMGAKSLYRRDLRLGKVGLRLTMGGGWRYDDATTKIYRTQQRRRWDRAQDLHIMVHDLSAHFMGELLPAQWVRILCGIRYDWFLFDVEGVQDFVRPSGALIEDQTVAGLAGKGALQPKASVIFSPLDMLDIFLNYGTAFHSPDARDPVLNAAEKIPLAYAGEVGLRIRYSRYLDMALSGWGAYLQQEVFFDPTEGRSIDQGRSRRLGSELEIRFSLDPWLYVYADLAYTDARLIDSNQPLIGSPKWLSQAGAVGRWTVPWGPALTKGSRLQGGFRLRYIGRRYLAQGKLGEDALIADLLVGWDTRYFGLELSFSNLFDSRWKDAQFFYQSRATLDEPLGGVADKHFTAGSPFEAKATVKLYLP